VDIKNKIKETHITKGDYVIVFGTSMQGAGVTDLSRTIAQVIEAGEFDVFLKCMTTNHIFKRSKFSCAKIGNPPEKMYKIVEATIGDLVLSYNKSRFSNAEKVLGILIELIDEPPYDLHAVVLAGGESHKVRFDTLIVVEGKKGHHHE